MRTRENKFRKYDHLERRGHREVKHIEVGLCHIFPKIDGTNASVYWDPVWGQVKACSRNRVLALGAQDNHGFCEWVNKPEQEMLRAFCQRHPHLIVYGEWLVPHSLKTYEEHAWREFYVFDVYDRDDEVYLEYDEYALMLINVASVIDPLCTIENPHESDLLKIMEGNTYLIKDGEGLGEGIVIKNYGWINAFRRQPWAKMVRNSFKESNKKAFGVPKRPATKQVEVEIIEEFVTESLVRKEWSKVIMALAREQCHTPQSETVDSFVETNRRRLIPWVLSQVYNCLIEEELWTALKKHRNPTIDFKMLNGLCTQKVKKHLPEIF